MELQRRKINDCGTLHVTRHLILLTLSFDIRTFVALHDSGHPSLTSGCWATETLKIRNANAKNTQIVFIISISFFSSFFGTRF